MKEKEISDKFVAKKDNEINKLIQKIEYDQLTYYFKSYFNRIPISFIDFNGPLGFIRKIKDGSVDLEKTKENLSETKTGKWEHKSEEQKSTINNLKILYKEKKKVIKLFDDYTTVVSKAKYEA